MRTEALKPRTLIRAYQWLDATQNRLARLHTLAHLTPRERRLIASILTNQTTFANEVINKFQSDALNNDENDNIPRIGYGIEFDDEPRPGESGFIHPDSNNDYYDTHDRWQE